MIHCYERLNSHLQCGGSIKKGFAKPRLGKCPLCHADEPYSFMALNGVSDVSAADWLSQTLVKNYEKFSGVLIRLFLVVKISIKHSSLYNKYNYISKNFKEHKNKMLLSKGNVW